MSTTATLPFGRHSTRFPIAVKPTAADIAIARTIAKEAQPAPEEVARALTWGADEKLLLALAASALSRREEKASRCAVPEIT